MRQELIRDEIRDTGHGTKYGTRDEIRDAGRNSGRGTKYGTRDAGRNTGQGTRDKGRKGIAGRVELMRSFFVLLTCNINQ